MTKKQILNNCYIELVDMHGDERLIVKAARVSYAGEDRVKDKLSISDRNLLRMLIRKGHTTPLEHIAFTFKVKCPLFVRSQWHRHRTWSYNEISRRYTANDIEFYIPDSIRLEDNSVSDIFIKRKISEVTQIAFKCYNDLLSLGVAPEQARMILPQNLLTVFYASVDLNNLLKFIELRIAPEAQREIRVFAEAIKAILEEKLPEFMKIYNEESKAKND